MEINQIVIWGALGISAVSIVGIIWNRITLKRGIGLRSIQFVIVTVMFPFLVIL